ncbi:hypothetical protein ACEE23_07900 [Corynebacterium sp. 32222D000AT]|uniref:hypothetical protein n=1 Tax=unclassified Corynebacterium TaxID=2624378 RepID=UPI002A9F8E66|nr:hypothetical protein [Mycobacteriaceae bacterium]MDY5830201.1 hypothetical protein [Corynebacterium sp.]
MNTDTRRVVIFVVVGLLVAAGVGVSVWHLGAPKSSSMDDNATPVANKQLTSSEEKATTSSSSTSSTAPSDRRDRDDAKDNDGNQHSSREDAKFSAPQANDPFLAPNSVVDAQTAPAAPTTYYRPDNLSASQGQQNQQGQQGQQGSQNSGQQGTQIQPTQPGQPTQPAPTTRPDTSEEPSTTTEPQPSSPNQPAPSPTIPGLPAEENNGHLEIQISDLLPEPAQQQAPPAEERGETRDAPEPTEETAGEPGNN